MGSRGEGASDGANAKYLIKYRPSRHTWLNAKRFVECLPVPSGALAGDNQFIKLLPWQVEVLKGIWPEDKHPKNEVLVSVARRNGKSIFLASIMTFLLFNNHAKTRPVQGSLFVSCAFNRDQARIIFNTIKLWCSTVQDLASDSTVKDFDGEVHRSSIQGVRYKAITSSPYSALGGNYAVVICDEVGFWRDNQLQVAIRHGMKSTPRDRRLFLQASTVPNIEQHFFWDEISYFSSKRDTATHYAYVAMTSAKDDDPSDEETWKKANPSYGYLVHKADFEDEWESVKMFPQRRRAFLAYSCNAVTNIDTSTDASKFLTPEAWIECQGASHIEIGSSVVIAWDASTTCDLSALVIMGLEAPHNVKSYFWIPRATALDERSPAPYETWEDAGWCEIIQTPAIPKSIIVDKYNECLETYDVVSSQSDSYSIGEIRQQADEKGVSLDAHMSRSTKVSDYHTGLEKLAELIKTQQIVSDNPILSFCIDNLRLKTLPSGAVVVDRKASRAHAGAKIDGAVCLLLCALQLAMTNSIMVSSSVVESVKNMFVEV